MARYATNEKHFECWSCEIFCTRREMVSLDANDNVFCCPNCDEIIGRIALIGGVAITQDASAGRMMPVSEEFVLITQPI